MLIQNVSSVSYRIYANIVGWQLLTVSKKPLDVVGFVKETLKQSNNIIVVVYDFDMDADTDVYTITSEEDFLHFKQKLLGLPQNVVENSKKLVKNSKNSQNIGKN